MQCPERIPVDGPDGLLAQLPIELKNEFADSVSGKDVGNCSQAFWVAISRAIQTKYRSMTELLDWLLALGTPPDSRRMMLQTDPGKNSVIAPTAFHGSQGSRRLHSLPGGGQHHAMRPICPALYRDRTSRA